jgi:hypothetical protein
MGEGMNWSKVLPVAIPFSSLRGVPLMPKGDDAPIVVH